VENGDPKSARDIFRSFHRDIASIADGTKHWGRWTYDPKSGHLVLDEGQPTEYSIPLASCATESGRLDWLAQVAEKNWSSDVVGELVRAMNDTYGLRQVDAFAGARPARVRLQGEDRTER
jgi:hypothetical protein